MGWALYKVDFLASTGAIVFYGFSGQRATKTDGHKRKYVLHVRIHGKKTRELGEIDLYTVCSSLLQLRPMKTFVKVSEGEKPKWVGLRKMRFCFPEIDERDVERGGRVRGGLDKDHNYPTSSLPTAHRGIRISVD